jgi:acetyl esterase
MREIAPLHPDAMRILATIAELEQGIVPPVPVSMMRALAKARNRRLAAEPPAVGRVEDRIVETGGRRVPIRLYHPHTAPGGTVAAYIHAHGGGFVVGDLDMADTVCRTICRDAGVAVVSVDYGLAPEHKFPHGLEDVIAMTRWVAANGAGLGIDPGRLAIGGDSAGGNLAAVTSLALVGELGSALRYQVLVYPVTDLTCSEPSYRDLGTGYPLTEARMRAYIGMYLTDAAQVTDGRASPLLAPSLEGQPPALVILAGLDPLRDEGAAYARRLTEAGTAAEVVEVPDHPHGFLGWTRDADAARRMLTLIAERLKNALAV